MVTLSELLALMGYKEHNKKIAFVTLLAIRKIAVSDVHILPRFSINSITYLLNLYPSDEHTVLQLTPVFVIDTSLY